MWAARLHGQAAGAAAAARRHSRLTLPPAPACPLPPTPLPVRRAGLSFGQLLAPNLMLLFMPVPHTSLFPWLTGLSRNQLIRYHRWVPASTRLLL